MDEIRKIMSIGVTAQQKNTLCYNCEQCGEIVQPYHIKRIDRYVKSTCHCAKEQRELEDQQRRLKKWLQEKTTYVFGWLGEQLNDESRHDVRFHTFKRHLQPNAYDTVQQFMENMDENLILHGTCGTGKTHLLVALCNELIMRGTNCRFANAPDLFDAMQDRVAQKKGFTDIVHQAMSTPLLVIDDIDKAKWTEFREETYFKIMDYRVNNGLPMAISTNKLHQLENYIGGACVSRLYVNQVVVEMIASDYRLTMRKKG